LGFPTGWLSCPHQANFLTPLPMIEEEEEAPTSTIFSHVNYASAANFLAPLPKKKKTSTREFRAHILYFVLSFALLYFLLASFYQKYKKINILIVIFTCLLLILLEWLLLKIPSYVILLALIIVILSVFLLRHLLLLLIFMSLSLLC
jgi:hypothetical protein